MYGQRNHGRGLEEREFLMARRVEIAILGSIEQAIMLAALAHFKVEAAEKSDIVEAWIAEQNHHVPFLSTKYIQEICDKLTESFERVRESWAKEGLYIT